MVAGSIIETRRWSPVSAATIVAAMLGWGTAAYFANSYVPDSRFAGEQDLAIRRIMNANMDLQVALDRVRDETERTLQQLRAENDALQGRISQFQQYLYSLEAAATAQASGRKGNRRLSARAAPPQLANIAAAGSGIGPAAIAQPVSAPPAALEGSTNFNAPGWVPNYFTDESASFAGSQPHGRASVGGRRTN